MTIMEKYKEEILFGLHIAYLTCTIYFTLCFLYNYSILIVLLVAPFFSSQISLAEVFEGLDFCCVFVIINRLHRINNCLDNVYSRTIQIYLALKLLKPVLFFTKKFCEKNLSNLQDDKMIDILNELKEETNFAQEKHVEIKCEELDNLDFPENNGATELNEAPKTNNFYEEQAYSEFDDLDEQPMLSAR